MENGLIDEVLDSCVGPTELVDKNWGGIHSGCQHFKQFVWLIWFVFINVVWHLWYEAYFDHF